MSNELTDKWETPEGKAALAYAHNNLALAKAFLAGFHYAKGDSEPVEEVQVLTPSVAYAVAPQQQQINASVTDENGYIIDLHDDEKSFDYWWNLYDKKRSKRKAFLKWKSLPLYKRKDCINATPAYVKSTPEVQYRKDPTTYLNGECYYDEIISSNEQQRFDPLAKAASILR